ncbi:MAG: hypothetical protein E7496_10650 [Ruminococcus sp.]|nr:hypothetical protein [Ruminococcus sp.]
MAEALVNIQDKHHVTVTNGKLADGSESGYFADGTVAVVTADTAPTGYKFGYWKRNGITISYNPKYTFFVTSDDIQLEAVYVEDTDDIERYGNATIENVETDKANQKIKFVSLLNVPEGCKILKAGVVTTCNEETAENLTIETSDYKTLYKENINTTNYRYTLTVQNDKALETWYVKGYLVYEDADGNEKTVYSDLVKANLDGYETIKEDKILGTAIMENVIEDTENQELKFITMTSVPADCKIVKSGVVATSDISKSENLTIDNSDYNTLFKTDITVHNYRYTLTIRNEQAKKTWYVRPYLVYTDADGKEFTVYGELSTGSLN